jgi:hypothetical protein
MNLTGRDQGRERDWLQSGQLNKDISRLLRSDKVARRAPAENLDNLIDASIDASPFTQPPFFVANGPNTCNTTSCGGGMDWGRFQRHGGESRLSKSIKLSAEQFELMLAETHQVGEQIFCHGEVWNKALVRNDAPYDPMVYLVSGAGDSARCMKTTLVDPIRFHCAINKQLADPSLSEVVVGYWAIDYRNLDWWISVANRDRCLRGIGEYNSQEQVSPQLKPVADLDALLDQFGDCKRVLPNRTAFALGDICLMQAGGRSADDEFGIDSWRVYKGTSLVENAAKLCSLVHDQGQECLRQYIERLMKIPPGKAWQRRHELRENRKGYDGARRGL